MSLEIRHSQFSRPSEIMGPQAGNTKFGVLVESEKPDAIAIYGPTISSNGQMTAGEVYRFLAPGSNASFPPVVDYQWLKERIGRRVQMNKVIEDAVSPIESIEFVVFGKDNSVEEIKHFTR